MEENLRKGKVNDLKCFSILLVYCIIINWVYCIWDLCYKINDIKKNMKIGLFNFVVKFV